MISNDSYKYQTCKNILDDWNNNTQIDPKYVLEKSWVNILRHLNPINFSSKKLTDLPCYKSSKSLIPSKYNSQKVSFRHENNTIWESAKCKLTAKHEKTILSAVNRIGLTYYLKTQAAMNTAFLHYEAISICF